MLDSFSHGCELTVRWKARSCALTKHWRCPGLHTWHCGGCGGGVGAVITLMRHPFLLGSGCVSLENTAFLICRQLSTPLMVLVCETLAFVRRREILDFLLSLLAVQICGAFLIDRWTRCLFLLPPAPHYHPSLLGWTALDAPAGYLS